jgi:AcrR family transcriptional regulator
MELTETKTDGRREVGERTCQRLLDATLALLAERGEDGVTLRDITDAAQANVAAVSYHFGSKDALIQRAINHAIDRVLDAQAVDLEALGDHPTPDGIAGAMVRPVIDALTRDGQELALYRIIVRATIKPTQGCRERLTSQTDRRRDQLLTALRAALPDVDEGPLMFRVESVLGLLDWLVLCAPPAMVVGKTRPQLEELLVPMLVGALAGAGAPAPAGA